MIDSVLNPDGDENAPVLRNAKGQWLTKPAGAKPFVKGQSGNPGGMTGDYHAAMKLARTKSKAVVERMVQLAELDSVDETGALAPLSHKADARVAAMASQWLWQVAWGKNGEQRMPDDDKPGITIEQRRDEAMATLMAAFDRVLAASKQAQSQPQDVVDEVIEPENESQVIDIAENDPV